MNKQNKEPSTPELSINKEFTEVTVKEEEMSIIYELDCPSQLFLKLLFVDSTFETLEEVLTNTYINYKDNLYNNPYTDKELINPFKFSIETLGEEFKDRIYEILDS